MSSKGLKVSEILDYHSNYLHEYYSDVDNKTISEYLGISEASLTNWAKAKNLKKSSEHISNLRVAQRKHWQLSEESKLQISNKLRGVAQGSERSIKAIATKRRNGTMYSGERHAWWNGGTTRTRFDDPRYKEWRTAVMQQSNYCCAWCGKPARETKYGSGLDCHHIKGWKNNVELRYEISNGMALCREHHIHMHKIVGYWS